METSLSDWRSHELSSKGKLVITDSASKYLEAWLQSIRIVYPSAFYNLVYDKLNLLMMLTACYQNKWVRLDYS